MCFMTIKIEVNSNQNCLYEELSTSYDEIFEKFDKLAITHSIFKKKNSWFENEVTKLLESKNDFEKEKINYESLIKENSSLQKGF